VLTRNKLALARDDGSVVVDDMVKVAMATGARQDELLKARRDSVDHDRRQLTIIGEGNKQRVIDLEPFDGYALISALPSYAGKPLLFWHSEGESFKSFAANFGRTVRQTAAWAKANDVGFRPFRFYDLRHW
jgi:integrase